VTTGYWDRDGKPIDVELWGRLFEDFDYRIVKRSPVEDGTVITAWLGYDGLEGPGQVPDGREPLIFGTLLPDEREFFHATLEQAVAFNEHKVQWYACRHNGGRNHLDDETEWVHDRINAGDTLTAIGREIGVTPQALGRRLRKYRARFGLEGREPYPGNRYHAKNPGAYRRTR
jgi:hypothetical protein